jgi:hypothetical protein
MMTSRSRCAEREDRRSASHHFAEAGIKGRSDGSVDLEPTSVAFSKRTVETGVRRGIRSNVTSSVTVACGVPDALFSTWNFRKFDSSKKSVAKVCRVGAATGSRPVF